jgi:hypothetical protein
MNRNLRGIFAIAILAAGCGAGGGDGGGSGGGTGGSGETTDLGVCGQGEGGQVMGGSGGAPVGGTVGGAGGESLGGSGGAVGGAGGEPVGGGGGAGGEPVGGSGGAVGGAGGEPVGGGGGAGGEPVGGAGGGIVPPIECGATDLNASDAGDGTFVAMGNTSAAENLYTGSCSRLQGLDAIFAFTAPAAGNWIFTTEVGPDVATFDTLIYALSDCANPESELACDDDGAAGTQSVIVIPLGAGDTTYIVVDGFSPEDSGDFWLTTFLAGDSPNLRPRAVSVAPRSVWAGGFVNIDFDAVNVGGATADAGIARLHLVEPGAAPGADTLLGEVDVPALDAFATAPLSLAVGLPADAAAGLYEVVVVLDATDAVDESDEADNTARTGIEITAEGACASDAYEPNRSSLLGDGGAAVVAVLEAGPHPDLTVCANDDDWYAVDLAPGEALRAAVTFDAGVGDVDLYLYGPDGSTELDSSRSGVASTETVEFFGAVAGGRHYLRVIVRAGAAGPATANTYALDLQLDPRGGCEPDEFDPNATSDSAAVVADGDYLLSLCPGVADWFRVTLVAGNTVSFLARSDAALHLTLYGPDDRPVADDDLTVFWDAEVDGIYRLKVESVAAIRADYSLRVRGASGIDLEAVSLDVVPAIASAGDEIRISGEVRNALSDSLQDVTARLLLSDDDLPSADDTELQRLVLPRVGHLDPATFRVRVRIPAGALAGERFIVLEVDPDRDLADARRPNNILAAPLEIRAACMDDDRQTNERPDSATPLAFDAGPVAGVICGYTEDWYSLEPAAGTRLTVTLTFDAAAGDLDLSLESAAGELLGESATEASPETVTIDAAGPVLVRVDGFLDAEAAYTLTWAVE